MSESFGVLLRRFRARAGLNVSELAEAVGASRTSIVEWEQGKRVPRDRARLEDLAQVLRLPAAEAAELAAAARQHRHLASPGAVAAETRSPTEGVTGLSAPTPASPRHQLRTPLPDFVGQEAALAALLDVMRKTSADDRVAAISGVRGMGGIGKTELAVLAANRLADIFPDAQIVLNLRGSTPEPLPPTQALAQVIHTFTPGADLPDELDALQRHYASALHGQRVLVLADDAQDAAQVRLLLPPAGCALLITSRTRFSLSGMTTIDLELLGEDEAMTLLQTVCPRLSAEEAQALAQACGYLPLALRVSGGILHNDPAVTVTDYLQRLTHEHQRLASLRDPDDRQFDVAAALMLSYIQLDATAQSVFRQLGVIVADFATTLAQAVVEAQPEVDVEAVLHYLLRRNLLVYDAQRGRWHMHDLVRDLARRELEDAEELTATMWRYAQAAVQIAQAAYKQFQPDTYNQFQADDDSMSATLARFDVERPHIDAAKRWASTHTATPEGDALLVANILTTYFLDSFLYTQRGEMLPQLEMALGAARRLNDRQGEAALLRYLGGIAYALGDVERAIDCCEQRLTIAQAIGDRHNEGYTLSSLGGIYAELGDPQRASRYFTEALTIAQEIEDDVGELRSLINLGYLAFRLGESRQAIRYQEQAMTIAYKLSCKRSEALILDNLGLAYLDLGEAQRAKAYIEQAIDIYIRRLGLRGFEAMLLPDLGRAALGVGEVGLAIECGSRAYTILRETGGRDEEGEALLVLGAGYAALGERTQAQETFEQALRLFREIGHRHGEAECSWALGLALVGWGERDQALPLMRAAVAYKQEIGHAKAAEHAAVLARLEAGEGLPADLLHPAVQRTVGHDQDTPLDAAQP